MLEVILVEDDEFLRDLFIEQLDLLGFHVWATDTVESVLSLYDTYTTVPVIVADINLKGALKGDAIISILSEKTLITPDVILMTGGTEISSEKALYLGARKLLHKPFSFIELSTEILKIVLLRNLSEKRLLDLNKLSHCESIGIRLQRGVDFPYYKYQGFNSTFIHHEKFLCAKNDDGTCQLSDSGQVVLECMCGNILAGRTDSKQPFFTPNGSFWTNSTTKLLETTSDADRQGHTRNFCNKVGYESVALVPIKPANGKISLGLFQLNDFHKDMFTLDLLVGLERMGHEFCHEIEQILF